MIEPSAWVVQFLCGMLIHETVVENFESLGAKQSQTCQKILFVSREEWQPRIREAQPYIRQPPARFSSKYYL